MSPEASDFAWILVVKPPRERPSAWPSCPPLLRPPTHARARCFDRLSKAGVFEAFFDTLASDELDGASYSDVRTPRRMRGTDNGAHRRTGDRHGGNRHFVKSFQGQDVRNSPRTAASESYSYFWPKNIRCSGPTSVHNAYFLLSRRVARQPMSRRKNPSGHFTRSIAAYARLRASATSLPSAVIVRTRPPSEKTAPSTSRVPP